MARWGDWNPACDEDGGARLRCDGEEGDGDATAIFFGSSPGSRPRLIRFSRRAALALGSWELLVLGLYNFGPNLKWASGKYQQFSLYHLYLIKVYFNSLQKLT
jgi:hypothetical protein